MSYFPSYPPAPTPTSRHHQKHADGKYYDSECFAICEGVKASSVKPDQAKKTCNMMQTGSSSSSSGTGPRNMMQQHGQAAPTRPATMQPPPSHSAALATCACPRILSPVCGSDGKLYNNECEAGCRGVVATVEKPDEQGRCPQPRPRPQQKPNSGSSSSSGTSAANANTEAAGNGALQTPPGTTTTPPKPAQPIRRPAGCICPMIWGPVCGSDGKVCVCAQVFARHAVPTCMAHTGGKSACVPCNHPHHQHACNTTNNTLLLLLGACLLCRCTTTAAMLSVRVSG